jgi:nitroreductase
MGSAAVKRDGHAFVPYRLDPVPAAQADKRGEAFYQELAGRRSVRMFSSEPVSRSCITWAIRAAATAPSGAHRQPWRFVAVSDPAIKQRIREGAEAEEQRNYGGRMPPAWLQALAPLGTSADKSYLEVVPWIVVVFAEQHGLQADGGRRQNYYVKESVGIACGLFIAALHRMGLATLTHTPSPMRFLNEILNRPNHEQPYILFPIGLPAHDCRVPDLKRKSLAEVAVFLE